MTEANGSAMPSGQTTGSPLTIQASTTNTAAPLNGRSVDPLSALPDDLRAHPSLQA